MKKPRFYCDFCGKEVSGQAKACPYCDHIFTSVRCPKCGFTAPASKFKFGCPSCGYSAPAGGGEPGPEGASAERGPTKPRREAPGPLPAWAFLAAALLLIFSVFGLIMLFNR